MSSYMICEAKFSPILWPPDAKSRLIEKGPDDGKILRAGGERGGRG